MNERMIPAEAVEAAARAIYHPLPLYDEAKEEITGHRPWEWLTPEYQESLRRDARAALEAAAPHMLVSTQRPERGWIAKNRNADGSVSIIGHFRNEAEAEKYAEMWPAAIVERAK